MENKEEKDKSVCTAEAVANLIQKPPPATDGGETSRERLNPQRIGR